MDHWRAVCVVYDMVFELPSSDSAVSSDEDEDGRNHEGNADVVMEYAPNFGAQPNQ